MTTLIVCLLGATAAKAQIQPGGTEPGQTTNYAVDGRALGSRLSNRALRDYKCTPSEQFNGFTWCQKTSRERERRGTFETSYSLLYAKDGTVVYVNRGQEPAFLNATQAGRDIQKYTRLFGAPPNISKMPRGSDTPEATIATWGRIELEPLDGDGIKLLAEGKSPKKGFLLDYLGDLSRSAHDGLPVYRIRGGAGFAWAASFDPKGRGTLRLVAVDASAFQPEPATSTQPVSAVPRSDEPQPSEQQTSATQQEPQPAAKADGDANRTITRLESELSLARQEKGQADETARLARTDAEAARHEMEVARNEMEVARREVEAARKEMENAKNAASAASAEIARLHQAAVAPSFHLDGSNAVPVGGAAVAILVLGVWLGWRASLWKARQHSTSDAETGTGHLEGISPPSPTDQPGARIDQEDFVRELGRQLGLEEVTAPAMTDAVPADRLEPVFQQESAVTPIRPPIPSKAVPPAAEATVDASR